MGETDQEPDPSKRVPTALWLMLGILLVVVFAAIVLATGGAIRPKPAVGPPAGAPPTPGQP
jgi:hypothetical protein